MLGDISPAEFIPVLENSFGNEILKKISRRLRKRFREGYVVGRFGGDEFTVFMPGSLTGKLLAG